MKAPRTVSAGARMGVGSGTAMRPQLVGTISRATQSAAFPKARVRMTVAPATAAA